MDGKLVFPVLLIFKLPSAAYGFWVGSRKTTAPAGLANAPPLEGACWAELLPERFTPSVNLFAVCLMLAVAEYLVKSDAITLACC